MMDTIGRAKKVRFLVFDVDGTLTDGSIIIGKDGELAKRFNVKDGLGISAARLAGLPMAIITGRKSGALEKRAAELKIEELYQGIDDKETLLIKLCTQKGINLAETAYVGDDLNDLAVLAAAGFAATPADAAPEARALAHYVSSFAGGRGAVRDIIEYILKAQGKWLHVLEHYHKRGCDAQ